MAWIGGGDGLRAIAAAPSCGALVNEARVALDGPPPSLKLEPVAAAPSHVVLAGRATRAIHSGHNRSRADSHRQHHIRHNLRRFPMAQVEILPDLALQAGGQRGPSNP